MNLGKSVDDSWPPGGGRREPRVLMRLVQRQVKGESRSLEGGDCADTYQQLAGGTA
jgi:hypothetical protein